MNIFFIVLFLMYRKLFHKFQILADDLIERLPLDVGNLVSLKFLILDGNQMTTLPDECNFHLNLIERNICLCFSFLFISHSIRSRHKFIFELDITHKCSCSSHNTRYTMGVLSQICVSFNVRSRDS